MALSLEEKIAKHEAELKQLKKKKKEEDLRKKREAKEKERQAKIDYMDSLMMGVNPEYQEKFLANLSWWSHAINKYYDNEKNNVEENQNLNQ